DPAWLSQWQGSRDFIGDIAKHSNIIYPIDVLRRNYRYLHRTFREFLTALELSKLESAERRKLVNEFIDKQGWAEILVLLGGLTSDVNDYLYQLLDGPPDLALRTLKEIKNLNPTLATQLLQLKSERLQDRKQVFVQLSQKLGSPDQVVDVLRAYHESIGPDIPRADLYFMMETLQRYDVSIAKDLLHDLLGYLPEVPKG